MTSKDELRLQVGQKLHDYGVKGQDNDYLTDFILNLLEGEKQKLEGVAQKALDLCDAIDGCHGCMGLNDSLQEEYDRLTATLNKEPNKGEDVDE